MPTPQAKLIGPAGRLYAEPTPTPDENAFQVDNTSAQYYTSPYYVLHKHQVQPIPPPRHDAALNIDVANFLPDAVMKAIDKSGAITFHAVGDTGAAKVDRHQTVATAVAQEAGVADAMAKDVATGGLNAPAFFFHLGDVVYNFGEAHYYYDQFYEPFRNYDRPIFAIPGNHDGMVFGSGSSGPQVPTLDAFLTNFCAATAGPSPDAGPMVRSVMTQPGVYFTLDAPFVSIIGLYSNVLDSGGGVISSRGGTFPLVDDQLAFLESELARLRPAREALERAIILAVHHPPLSVDAKSGGSTALSEDIDLCCKNAGLWPDAVLSAHAHLYQRFTRVVNLKQIPYVVSGSGGFAATPPQSAAPKAPHTIGDHTLVIDPIVQFGYLTITTDAKTLTITFKTASRGKRAKKLDSVTVDLAAGKITKGGTAKGKRAGKPSRRRPAKPHG